MNVVWANVTVSTAPGAFPWGKHKGKQLCDIPRDYLVWAIENADAMKPELRREIEAQLGLPLGSTGPPPSKPSEIKPKDAETKEDRDVLAEIKRGWAKDTARVRELEIENRELRNHLAFVKKDRPSDLDVFRRMLKQVFATLSRKYHPDLGGSPEKQVIVNDFYKALIQRLETTCEGTSNGRSK